MPPIRRWRVADLQPAVYNPRTISPEERAQLGRSLDEFGLVEPLVVNVHPERRGIIVGGHQRHSLAVERGQEELDAVEVDLDEVRERELNARLNANRGRFDHGALVAGGYDRELLEQWGLAEQDLKAFDAAVEKAEQALAAEAPVQFPEIDESIRVEHQCPKCGYLWSGSSAPRGDGAQEADGDGDLARE